VVSAARGRVHPLYQAASIAAGERGGCLAVSVEDASARGYGGVAGAAGGQSLAADVSGTAQRGMGRGMGGAIAIADGGSGGIGAVGGVG